MYCCILYDTRICFNILPYIRSQYIIMCCVIIFANCIEACYIVLYNISHYMLR